MSNIAINNYCNLKCPYCFADDMIAQSNINMSIQDYEKVIDFILKNPIDSVNIIGGEPTLHPQFENILKITKQKTTMSIKPSILFTNGIELEKYLPLMDNIDILINCNDPKYFTKEQSFKFNATLDKIFQLDWFNTKVTCGCNIHLNNTDYSYFWNIVDKYKLKTARCSVVSPGGIYKDWKSKKDEYFTLLKPIFLNFCQEAKKHDCVLCMDCAHIPFCYFNDMEIELIKSICNLKYCKDFCHCVIDITPDLKATSCFGVYQPIDFLDKFHNTIFLNKYLFNNFNKILALSNNTDKCYNCEKLKNLQCQGGCLAFSCPS